MPSANGESDSPHAALELTDVLHLRTTGGETLDFEVMGIVEDEDTGTSYAVLWRDPGEGDEQFIVTDLAGKILEDEALAQEILDDFLASAEES